MKTKENNKAKKVILQDRDYELMRYILEQKFLSREQIEKWFYKTQDISRNRLLKLMFSKCIKKEPVALSSKDHFLITGLGLRALAERGVNGIRPASSIDIRFYFHDKAVTDLRLVFESIDFARDWKSEKILRSEIGSLTIIKQEKKKEYDKKIPDGVFVSPAGKKIAFELEMTAKENNRYRNILKGYLKKHGVDRIFYVVRGEALFYQLKGLITGYDKKGGEITGGKIENSNQILLCKLEDIERDSISAEVFWGSNRITIKELIDAK